ncbi:divergent PAP2 family protein [candidate division FCPU426 bacterium]|nr:divergent PAP2 family protein [candidate division FCPU426 bacterium]
MHVILTHKIVWVVLTAWFAASLIKVLIHLIQEKRFDFRLLVDTGRMPSSHSAFICSLATVIGLETGWSSPIFMLALGVAILVMNDAAGVRRAAGHQARILNMIMDDLNQKGQFKPERLKEFLGHTRLEVMAGSAIGIIWGLLFY